MKPRIERRFIIERLPAGVHYTVMMYVAPKNKRPGLANNVTFVKCSDGRVMHLSHDRDIDVAREYMKGGSFDDVDLRLFCMLSGFDESLVHALRKQDEEDAKARKRQIDLKIMRQLARQFGYSIRKKPR